MRPHNTTRQCKIHHLRQDNTTRWRTTPQRDDHAQQDATNKHDTRTRTIHGATIRWRHNPYTTMRRCGNLRCHGTRHEHTMTRQQDAKTWRRDDATMQRYDNDAKTRRYNNAMTTTQHTILYNDTMIQQYQFTLNTKHLIPNTTNCKDYCMRYR
jgi:hypothetical protein